MSYLQGLLPVGTYSSLQGLAKGYLPGLPTRGCLQGFVAVSVTVSLAVSVAVSIYSL